MWYLSDPTWPEPNLILLTNALAQTGWRGAAPTPANWRELIHNRLQTLDWKTVVSDVRPFLERPEELDLLNFRDIAHLLQK